MPSRRTVKDTPAKRTRRWRVVLLRANGEILGTVEASDVAAARAKQDLGDGVDQAAW